MIYSEAEAQDTNVQERLFSQPVEKLMTFRTRSLHTAVNETSGSESTAPQHATCDRESGWEWERVKRVIAYSSHPHVSVSQHLALPVYSVLVNRGRGSSSDCMWCGCVALCFDLDFLHRSSIQSKLVFVCACHSIVYLYPDALTVPCESIYTPSFFFTFCYIAALC